MWWLEASHGFIEADDGDYGGFLVEGSSHNNVSIKVHGLVKSLRRPVGSGSWKVLVARTRLSLDRVNL